MSKTEKDCGQVDGEQLLNIFLQKLQDRLRFGHEVKNTHIHSLHYTQLYAFRNI